MANEKTIPPIPFDFKEAVSRLLKVKPAPRKASRKTASKKRRKER